MVVILKIGRDEYYVDEVVGEEQTEEILDRLKTFLTEIRDNFQHQLDEL